MTSKILAPEYDIDTCRNIVKNNPTTKYIIQFEVITDETWLPLILSQTGFFKSNGEVKRNRNDLWRDVEIGETVKLKWCDIGIYGIEIESF